MMRFCCCTLAMVTLVTALSGTAAAQAKFEIVPPVAGACAVRITVSAPGDTVRELRIDDNAVPLDKMTRSGDLDVIVPLRGPLQQGDRLQAFLQSGDASPAVRTARGVNRDTPCEAPAKKPADD